MPGFSPRSKFKAGTTTPTSARVGVRDSDSRSNSNSNSNDNDNSIGNGDGNGISAEEGAAMHSPKPPSSASTTNRPKSNTQRQTIPLRSPDSHVKHDVPSTGQVSARDLQRKSIKKEDAPVPTPDEVHMEHHSRAGPRSPLDIAEAERRKSKGNRKSKNMQNPTADGTKGHHTKNESSISSLKDLDPKRVSSEDQQRTSATKNAPVTAAATTAGASASASASVNANSDSNGQGQGEGPNSGAPLRMLSNGMGAAGRQWKKAKRKVGKQVAKKHAVERAIVCIFAIILVWISSLGVARFIVRQFIESPTIEEVVRQGRSAIRFTETEKERYESCANRRVAECNQTFFDELEKEQERTETALEVNRDIIDEYYEKRDNCNKEAEGIVDLLNGIQEATGANLNRDYSKTGSEEDDRCAHVADYIEGKAAAMGSLGAATEFKQKSDDTVDSGYDRFEARAAYDAEYLANKTGVGFVNLGLEINANLPDVSAPYVEMEQSSDRMVACSRVSGEYNGAKCSPSPAKRMDDMRKEMDKQYDVLKSRLDSWKVRAQGIRDTLNDFFSAFAGVSGIAGWMSDAFGVSWPGSNLPSFPSFSNPSDIFSGISPDFNDVVGSFEVEVNKFQGIVVSELNAAEQIRELMKNKTLGWQTDFMDDYDPPSVNVQSRRSSWANVSNPFLGQLSFELEGLNSNGSSRTTQFQSSLNETSVPRVSSSFMQSLDPRAWSFFFYDMSIDDFISQYNYVTWLALFFDYLYRALRSISLIRKYWRIGAVFTPPADVRVDVQKAATVAPDRKNPVQRAAYYLTHPALIIMLGITFLSIIVTSFLQLYLPIYYEYAKGCVAETNAQESNGTMVTRNLNSISFQYSTIDGDKTRGNAIDRINALREIECTSDEDESLTQQRELDDEYDFLLRDQRQLRFQVNALNDCLNISAIDSTFATEIGAPPTLDQVFTTAQTTCNQELAPLDPALFNCSNIKVCSPDCRGPNERVIGSTVFNAGCTAEYYVHAAIMTGGMSLVVYFLMNLSRVLMMEGLVRMYWRHLTSNKFSYLGTCYRTGDLEYPEKVKFEGWTMKKAIAHELQTSLRKFERAGAFILFCAILVNVPWLVLLDVISKSLAFEQGE